MINTIELKDDETLLKLDYDFAGGRPTDLTIDCSDGALVQAYGVVGFTVDEEIVPLFGLKDGVLQLPRFIWSHYHTILCRIKAENSTAISFSDKPFFGRRPEAERFDGKQRFAVSDVKITPTAFSLQEAQYFLSRPQDDLRMVATVTPDRVVAGSTTNFVFEVTMDEDGLNAGGEIHLFPHFSSWSKPSVTKKDIDVVSESPVDFEADTFALHWGGRSDTLRIKLTKGQLRKGDVVRVSYHGADGGITVQPFSTMKPIVFRLFVDRFGNGNMMPLATDQCPKLEVLPGEAATLRFKAPMQVHPGKPFEAAALVLDEHHNPVSDVSPTIEIYLDGAIRLTAKVAVNGRGAFDRLVIDTPGMHYLEARADGLTKAIQPVNCAEAHDMHTYFGALHVHTEVSDGEGTPDQCYDYARNVGLLDVCVVMDHAWEIFMHHRNEERGRFQGVIETAQNHLDEGRFVTLPGYEWMGRSGHINIYFPDNKTDIPKLIDVGIRSDNPIKNNADFFDALKNTECVLIPHTSHGIDWRDFEGAPIVAVELYAMWGYSEFKDGNGANAGLKSGLQFSFVGGSDAHHGRAGQCGRLSKYKMLHHKEGFAAIMAPSLTRSDIYAALKKGQTYATTGERMYVDFRLNGLVPENDREWEGPETLTFTAVIGGTTPIERIELIHDGEVIHTAQGNHIIETYEHTLSRKDLSTGAHYFYVRVTQTSGDQAWASPFYVKAVQSRHHKPPPPIQCHSAPVSATDSSVC